MGKYEPLARYLTSHPDDNWTATFAQIERALGFTLPRSARQYRAWWANEREGTHSQSAGWQEAGWETRDVDLKREIVTFERRASLPGNAPSSQSGPDPDLLRTAAKLTGIDNREKLINAALSALIHQHTARQLAMLGGAMPEFAAAPRERPAA